MTNHRFFAFGLLFFATMAWGGNIVIGRAVAGQLPPLGLSFWRWLVTFGLLVLFALPGVIKRGGKDFAIARKHWKSLVIMASLGLVAFHPMQYYAVQSSTAINATLILSTCPVMVALLSAIILKEPLGLPQILGILIAFTGVAVVISQADLGILMSLQFNAGDGWMFGSAVVWAFYSISLKYRPQGMDSMAMLMVMAGIASMILLPLYLWESATVMVMPVTSQAFITVAYVSVFASLLAYLAFNQGVAIVGPTKSGTTLNLIPVWVTLLAVIFLGERLEIHHLYGLVMIGFGIFLNSLPARETALA